MCIIYKISKNTVIIIKIFNTFVLFQQNKMSKIVHKKGVNKEQNEVKKLLNFDLKCQNSAV